MSLMPLEIGRIHFVGIGGIGMSGIAEILHSLGYTVQGSDISESTNVARLRKLGLQVAIGHAAENLGEAEVVVISSAVKPGNPELDAARAGRLPVVRRAEMGRTFDVSQLPRMVQNGEGRWKRFRRLERSPRLPPTNGSASRSGVSPTASASC